MLLICYVHFDGNMLHDEKMFFSLKKKIHIFIEKSKDFYLTTTDINLC